MDRVVFLDRDGTLNEEVHYLHRPEDFKLIDGVPKALRLLKQAGFKLVVVTNQAGVARGYYTEEDVKKLHLYMNSLLEPEGASIDAFYYCPHHPLYGLGKYKKECGCRKPGIGMFEMAQGRFDVDKDHSYMIGDKLLDVEAGRNYGLTSILVGTGYGRGQREQELEARRGQEAGVSHGQEPNAAGCRAYDYYADTLLDAALWIVEKGQV